MSYNYDRFDRRRQSRSNHSVLGHWVPLVLTVTAATIGLAVWIWSERRDSVEDDDDSNHPRPDYGPPPPDGYSGPPPGPYPPGSMGGPPSQYGLPPDSEMRGTGEEDTFMARMSGAIRRTPSPQQLINTAGKQITAGVAAAGAAVGGALQSIREEDKDDFGDHSRWSEETEERRRAVALSEQSTQAVKSQANAFNASVGRPTSLVQPSGSSRGSGRRRNVGLVVSAESGIGELNAGNDSYRSEHTSILSHLPTHLDPARTNLFIFIYAPNNNTSTSHASLPSSYSAISTPAITPGSDLERLSPKPDESPLFDALYNQATALVDKKSQIMPFTTPNGYVPMVKALELEIVYVSDALAGEGGRDVLDLRNWVRQIVVVVGDEAGGLLDTEDEGEDSGVGRRRWYEESDAVGLGKGVEILDAGRIGEEWERRVNGRE
ncbi:hypothetical protein EV356DRAFT_507425 [Viridothelium virens]|uniref:Uncharacterized protein n=1 Tax=Viridothelium virens TaxID=1048519 RepID=A0A6A6HJK7_VIRVR|nr:hypothetical protein EV356DRAFT_507425 [Viridothelium virens]